MLDSSQESERVPLTSAPAEVPDVVEVRFINFDDDIYDATVVAAFGGVRLDLATDTYMILHPAFLFLACLALTSIQLALIVGVALEVDQAAYFTVHQEAIDRLNTSFDMERGTKFALMAVLQSMIFSELFEAVRMVWFSLSPGTWRRRPELKDTTHLLGRCGFQRNWTLVPFALFASASKGLVAYLVSATSISIIFTCGTVTEAIFNSLALTFVMELDNKVWSILTSTSDFKICDPDSKAADVEFKFMRKKMKAPCLRSFDEAYVRRGLVNLSILYFLIDQLVVTLYTLSSGWLPTTRLMCGGWYYARGGNNLAQTNLGEGWGASALKSALEICQDKDYEPSYWRKYREVMKDHPKCWWSVSIAIILFLMVPPATRFLLADRFKGKAEDVSPTDSDEDESTLTSACSRE
mmetsp:Transcript_110557/g.276890  ORF Transcript_110557/g.276890 Transcript_110557/m.276890 type:complete len:409 (-) Transcript_110557:41-1267(-)